MPLRFTKADASNGVDPHFVATDPRVLVKPSEVPAPTHPEDDGFWVDFDQVIDKVSSAHDRARLCGVVSKPIKDRRVLNAAEAAEMVHNDWPSDIMMLAAKFVSSDYRTLTGLGQSTFTDKVVLLNKLIAEAAWRVSPSSFCTKWHYMRARPEEVAGAIAREEIDAPYAIKAKLFNVFRQSELASNQLSFTMFPEGCPNHPAYNAMHSAAAGAIALVIKVMFDLTGMDRHEVDMTAYDMAFFRTRAGVHYPTDNSIGLWMGEETVTRWLPDVLLEIGVPTAEIESAFVTARTDWLM